MKYILIAIGVVVVIGGGSYALVSRNVLKSFFQTGDKPTQEQFSDTIDSPVSAQADVPSAASKERTPTKAYVAGDTVVKSDSIYQAKVLTQTQTEFKLDVPQPVTFRWTPVVPKPQQSVTYRLKVWQLMQGQNGSQAMRSNLPIVTKDVDNVAEATVSGIYTGPCKPPYLCDFVWSVETDPAAGTKADTVGATGATAAPASDVSAPASASTQAGSASDGTR